MTEAGPAIVAIPVPIPFRPHSVNAFRVPLDAGGWMLVDGGLDTPEAWEALGQAINETGGWDDLRIHFITHMHLDHIGLAARVRERVAPPLVMSFLDADRAASAAADPDDEASYRAELLKLAGAPEEIREKLEELNSAGRRMAPFVAPDRTIPMDEAVLEEAPEWAPVWTPGHTAGHLCLFRKRDRILISGDCVLPRISPTIGVNRQRSDPVSDYLGALDRLLALEPRCVLPGHGEELEGAERISELRAELLAESGRVADLLTSQGQTAWEVAGARYAGRDLPLGPRIQAFRECLAHLRHLENGGHVESRTGFSGQQLFYLAGAPPD